MPEAGAATPASRMTLPGQLIHASTVAADLNGFSAVTRSGRHEPDGIVAVPVVVPVHESRHPQAGFVLAAEGPVTFREVDTPWLPLRRPAVTFRKVVTPWLPLRRP